MPGFLGGNKAAAGGVPPGVNLKNALIQAAPLFASMAAGYSSGRGPYAYMDQGIASIQANQKAKRDEEAAAAAAAAFGNLRPGGMGAAGGTGGYGGGYKPPTDLPKANIGGISGMGQAGLSLPGVAPADMGMVGNGGLSFGGTSLPPEQAAIRAGLVARGYAPHVADGIMMNLADESAFNPAAVGDGGNALGLAQWNGPRKAALENFAASQGKSPTDIDVQLDFLDYELKGSHARAGEALMAAKTAPEAATVFLNQFEIPAEKYRVAREAAYLGGGTAPAAPAGPVDPMSDPYVQQLMAVMSMRGITPEQQAVLQMQLQSRIGMLTAPQPGAEEEAARAMRERDADLLGYTRGSPEWNQYVVTGEMPKSASPLEVGGVLLDPTGQNVLFDSRVPPAPAGAEEEAARAMRARDADLLGYTRGSPEWNQYVVTGEMPKPAEPAKPYSSAGEIQADLRAGFITQDQADAAMGKIGGGVTVNNDLGGTGKQVYDTIAASADKASTAAVGINSLAEAKKALDGGAITGFAADQRLYLQKLGSYLGISDPAAIENTETFRAAIAPQVSAMIKATVGSANISNSDREFAEKAAAGSISLDEASIKRMIGVMERMGYEAIKMHNAKVDAVYPEGQGFDRERALFLVPAPGGAAPPSGAGTVIDGYTIEAMP